MNKFLSISLLAIWVMSITGSVSASTIATLAPETVDTSIGKTFTISVSVNPKGGNDFAEKIALDFPASIVEVKSFTFAQNWTALSQANYDVTDNTKGVLVKTAGYAGGVTGPTLFGTVTFQVLKSGTGSIKLSNDSQSFIASGESTISGNEVRLTVSTPIEPVKLIAQPVIKTVVVASSTASSTVETDISSSTDVGPTILDDQTAAVGDTSSDTNWIIWVIAVLVLIGFIWYFFRPNTN